MPNWTKLMDVDAEKVLRRQHIFCCVYKGVCYVSIKINHFARPIETNVKTSIEAGFIEFFIGVICACFAYFTYDEALVLFVSTALIAVVCFVLTLYNIFCVIQDLRAQRRNRDVQDELKSDV